MVFETRVVAVKSCDTQVGGHIQHTNMWKAYLRMEGWNSSTKRGNCRPMTDSVLSALSIAARQGFASASVRLRPYWNTSF